MASVIFRLHPERRDVLKSETAKDGIGIQHLFDALTDIYMDHKNDRTDPRTHTVMRRAIERARFLKNQQIQKIS